MPAFCPNCFGQRTISGGDGFGDGDFFLRCYDCWFCGYVDYEDYNKVVKQIERADDHPLTPPRRAYAPFSDQPSPNRQLPKIDSIEKARSVLHDVCSPNSVNSPYARAKLNDADIAVDCKAAVEFLRQHQQPSASSSATSKDDNADGNSTAAAPFNVNAPFDEYNPPLLHCAVGGNSAGAIRALLELGADPNIEVPQSDPPIVQCAKYGLWRAAEILLNHRSRNVTGSVSDILSKAWPEDEKKETRQMTCPPPTPAALAHALSISVASSNQYMIDLLLKNGAKPPEDEQLFVALLSHSRNNATTATTMPAAQRVKFLDDMLAFAASAKLSHDAKNRCLLVAAKNRGPVALKIVRKMLEAGADPNYREEDTPAKYTPLIAAGGKAGNAETLQLLLECGADRNAKLQNGKTALDLATHYKFHDVVKILNA